MPKESNQSIKSYIVSVNGEGLTADVLIKYSEDLPKLESILDMLRVQCVINDNQKNDEQKICVVNEKPHIY